MKTLSFFSVVAALLFLSFFAGCKKDPGLGGRAHIHGHVEYNEDHVSNAFVFIWYGVSSVADHHSGFDNKIITNSEGEFEFENLNKGNYYLYAEWENSNGEEKEGEVAVTISKKSGEVEAHIELE